MRPAFERYPAAATVRLARPHTLWREQSNAVVEAGCGIPRGMSHEEMLAYAALVKKLEDDAGAVAALAAERVALIREAHEGGRLMRRSRGV